MKHENTPTCNERSRGTHDCHEAPVAVEAAPQAGGAQALLSLEVSGMGCPACAARVRNALVAVRGVIGAYVRLEAGRGSVIYDPRRAYPLRLLEAIEREGRRSRHAYRAAVTGVRLLAGP